MFDFAPGADFEAERASDEDVALDREGERQGGVPGKGSRIATIFGLVQRRAIDSGAARGVVGQAGRAAAGGAVTAGGATAVGGATAGGAAAGGASAGRGEVAGPADDPFGLHLAAAHGVSGAAMALPYRAELERAMGVDLGGVTAHVGGAAADACEALDARAYATGDRIAFGSAPDLHTAAHEVAHVLQQRAGIELPGGIGAAGDAHERAADDIADAVVRGESVRGRLPTGGARAPSGATVQRAGMGDVRRVEGGQQLEAEANTGPEAEFLRQLEPAHIKLGPALRMERDRPLPLEVYVKSPLALPRDVPSVPVWCNFFDARGAKLDNAGGDWRAKHERSPRLRFTVPAPGRYRVEVHVNAGRPGARVLERAFLVRPTSERNAASDEASQLAKRGGAAPVGTYREMLVAVLAARALTERGDPASYQRAIELLEPVRARMQEIFPTVLERSRGYGYSRNAIDLRFGGAQSAIRAWVARLELGSTIKPDPLVTEFEAGMAEIKMGTGEKVDDRDLRALDGAAVTSAKAVGIATAVVVLLPVAAELGAMAGAKLTASTIGAWAATHPMQALALAEFVIGTGIGIGEAGGPGAYIDGLKEDIPLTILQILIDIANYQQAGAADKELQQGPRGGGMRELPAGEAPAPAPKQLGPGSGEEVGGPPARGRRGPAPADEEGGRVPAARPAVEVDPPSPIVAKGMQAAGMTKDAVEAVLRIAKAFKVRISFRPTNPHAAAQLAKGAEPKPESIKANTVNELDVHLGMPEKKLGLVAHWKGWRLPGNIGELDVSDPALAKRIRARYDERMASYDKYAAEMDGLVKGGQVKIEDGIVHNNKTGNAYTGDYDLYSITELDGTPIPEGSRKYKKIAKELKEPPVAIQHGPLKDWPAKSAEAIEHKRRLIDRHEKDQDIVNIGPDDIDVGTRK